MFLSSSLCSTIPSTTSILKVTYDPIWVLKFRSWYPSSKKGKRCVPWTLEQTCHLSNFKSHAHLAAREVGKCLFYFKAGCIVIVNKMENLVMRKWNRGGNEQFLSHDNIQPAQLFYHFVPFWVPLLSLGDCLVTKNNHCTAEKGNTPEGSLYPLGACCQITRQAPCGPTTPLRCSPPPRLNHWALTTEKP